MEAATIFLFLLIVPLAVGRGEPVTVVQEETFKTIEECTGAKTRIILADTMFLVEAKVPYTILTSRCDTKAGFKEFLTPKVPA